MESVCILYIIIISNYAKLQMKLRLLSENAKKEIKKTIVEFLYHKDEE